MNYSKRLIKGYYLANKEISDYKKIMEDAFIEYLRTYIKSRPIANNNAF